MGRYVTPTILHEALLRAASKCLKGVRIEVADFRRLESYVDRGDFVYLDPPYAPLSATSSFTAYSAENFRSEDQRDLRDCVEALSSRCQWMLSNSAAPLIEDLYARPGMFKYKVMARRAINSVGASRGPVEEFVITNYKLENRDPD
jgi:DNA adenine methylase